MPRVVRLCSTVALGLFALARSVGGQSMSGVEAGVVAPGDERLFQVGYRFSALRRNAPGIEIAVATLPHALAFGIVLLGADLDAAFLLSPTETVGLVARAGVSTIAGAGGGGGGAIFGYNIGGGILVRASSRAAVRVDYTHRRFTLDGDTVSLPSLTFGVAWFH